MAQIINPSFTLFLGVQYSVLIWDWPHQIAAGRLIEFEYLDSTGIDDH